ncbi:c-type cytochrome [Jiella sp. MQZ9-1]|nr:cytochrome c family protein [Jiella flava]MCD2471778.1 c-type cytochrome [Jiella flava]
MAGDPAAGEKVFNKCKACHAIGEGAKNKIGPELNGIVGEKIAVVDGYSFSSALQTYAKDHPTWTVEELHAWLTDPKAVAPGTKMSFPGLKDKKDIDNVIAYLASFDENGQKKTAEAAPQATNPATTTESGANAGAETTHKPAEAKPTDNSSGEEAASEPPKPEAKPADETSKPAEPQQNGASSDQGAATPAPNATQTAMAGDPAAGEKVFNKCKACHAIGEGAKNKIGPELNGIVGEKIAVVDGYSFSSALQNYAKDHPTWTVEELHAWLTDPKAVAPGTKMSFPGLKDKKDIDNVIAYLASFDENGQKKGQ